MACNNGQTYLLPRLAAWRSSMVLDCSSQVAHFDLELARSSPLFRCWTLTYFVQDFAPAMRVELPVCKAMATDWRAAVDSNLSVVGELVALEEL